MERRGEGSRRTTPELDSWTNYSSCKWIENPAPSPSPSPTGAPEIIPDSGPSSSSATPASCKTDGCGEEELASVPSTVQVGSPGISEGGNGLSARPAKSLGGTWRNPDGSWSLKNFEYEDDADNEDARGAPADPDLRHGAAEHRGLAVGDPLDFLFSDD